jgi:hypothetical protein
MNQQAGQQTHGSYKSENSGATIVLDDNNYKTEGGEGAIYIDEAAGRVHKICFPGMMIPRSKFDELAMLDHPRIRRPDDILLKGKQEVGYSMPLVPGNAIPLAQMLTKTYQEREGVTPDKKAKLVLQMADALHFIWSKGCTLPPNATKPTQPGLPVPFLQVDGNELNYMVEDSYEEIHLIDVNGFQTPTHPVNTIMLSVMCPKVAQDPSTGLWQWSPESDAYSFAIVAWYIFTCIHPYKGMHPDFPDKKTFMLDQMKANVSVLHQGRHAYNGKDVGFPKGAVYYPFFDYIPGGETGAYGQWFTAVLRDGKLMLPPREYQAVIAAVIQPVVKEVVGSDNFIMTVLKDYGSLIVGHYASKGKSVIVTKDRLYIDHREAQRPQGRFRVGFTSQNNHAVAATLTEDGDIRLQNLDQNVSIRYDGSGKDIMSCDGRLYVLAESNILEIMFQEMGAMTIATTRAVASVMPNATKLFQGCAFQTMIGNHMCSIFPQSGHHRQFKLAELSGYEITDAKCEQNVLMVVAVDRSTGEYKRFVFRLSRSTSEYDCRIVENITPTGLNFTVVPEKGVCICINEEEKVEIFSVRRNNPSLKIVDDPAVVGDMRLCNSGGHVRFAHGTKLYDFSMKK